MMKTPSSPRIYLNSNFQYNDITQAVIWDQSDYDKVCGYFQTIREFQQKKDRKMTRKLIDSLDQRLERAKDDKSIVSGPKPLAVIEKCDLVTAPGRSRAAELITGESDAGFNNMAIGLSQIAPQDSDFKLYEEIGRVSSLQTGLVSASGAVIKHVATFSPSFPTNTYWEVAPVDSDVENDEQSIFARVVFDPERPAVHVAGEDFFTIHHSTYTSSGL